MSASRSKTFKMTLALAAALFVTGPVLAAPKAAPAPKAEPEAQEESSGGGRETINRAIFQFNRTFDGVLLRPITSIYRGVVPDQGQEMVSNAVDNIYTPVTFANSVLQADPQNSFASLWRFLINSTVGIGGLFDPADAIGLKMRRTDFGQTLAIYGADTGSYVVLPIIGPSNARDAVGRLADAFINPFNYIGWTFSAAMWGTTAVDARSRNMSVIDDIYKSSIDPYSTFRSGYTQHRASDVRRAKESRSASRRAAGFE